MRRLPASVGAAALLVLLPGMSAAVVHDVEILDDVFSPAAIVVAEGDTILWTHEGFHPHTVDQTAPAGDCLDLFGGFGSGLMAPGDTFSWVAAGLGDVQYHCDFHCPSMVGEITVEESAPVASSTWSAVKVLYH